MLHLAGRTEDAESNRHINKGRQMQRRLCVGRSVGSGLADVVAPTNAGSERVKTRTSEQVYKNGSFFGVVLYTCALVDCAMERGTNDWNSRAELRERPEGDRLIASTVSVRLNFN
ncbi:hypothetical protein C6N29_07495 [Flavobacterium columnare]|nr:hypothetical protein C6N29_07495 [Flavobacterium columnare]